MSQVAFPKGGREDGPLCVVLDRRASSAANEVRRPDGCLDENGPIDDPVVYAAGWELGRMFWLKLKKFVGS